MENRLQLREQLQSGLVLVDKEAGPSSFAVVQRVRRLHGARKAGHAGTLDPLATGLLLVLLMRATRLARYLVGLDKRYVTEIRLGERTSTGDAEGEVVELTPSATEDDVRALLGEPELRVPAASAVKIEGERAYRLLRRGVAVEMPLRRSQIHEIDVRVFAPPRLELALHVSSGTYVRSIAHALGGHCVSLRRTAVGPFSVEDSDEARLLPPLEAVRFLPRLDLSTEEERRVRAGRALPGAGEGPLALVRDGELVAVARAGAGVIRPEAVLV